MKTIAIPAWGNLGNRYKLNEWLPRAIGREFLTRTRYRVVADPNDADALLTGNVNNILSFPSIIDPANSRGTAVQVTVFIRVQLEDRKTGKVLYYVPNMEFRTRYEIAVQQSAYFEESDVALERLSRDVARTVVSSILEAF